MTLEPNSSYYCNIPFIHSHIMNEFNKVCEEYNNTEIDIVEQDGEDKWVSKKSKEQLQKDNELLDNFFDELPNYNDLKLVFIQKIRKSKFYHTDINLDYYSYQDYFDLEIEPDNLYQRDIRLSIYDYDRYYQIIIGEELNEKTLDKHRDIEEY